MSDNNRIDRIDRSGNITEHVLRDDGRTLCGIKIEQYQQRCGNRRCQRCERELRRQQMKAATPLPENPGN